MITRPLAFAFTSLFLPWAAATGHVAFGQEFVDDAWIAVRFEIDPETDLQVLGGMTVCNTNSSFYTKAAWRIVDGQVGRNGYQPVQLNWLVGADQAEVGVNGQAVPVGIGGEYEVCQPGSFGWTGWPPAERSVALVALAKGDRGSLWFNATWTKGVRSYEIATGDPLMKHRTEFDRGVSAETSSIASYSAISLLAEERETTQRDLLGWFTPHWAWSPEPPLDSTCTQNGRVCDGYEEAWNTYFLAAKGDTDWHFGVPVAVDTYYPPMSLALVELPDDEWIATS